MADDSNGIDVPSAPESAGADQTGLLELRRLLFGREQAKLEQVAQRVENPTLRGEDISHVLPQAVTACVQRDTRLAQALAPAVESALATSVRRDPKLLATAIFPIMGPAIRKSIAESLRWLMDSFSRALDQSLSWRGLLWRWESWRTGRPFAQVVLYHTLVYRVEQVFLVHRETGLLLLHVSAPDVPTSNEDLTAGMLTAVRDFAKDSFGTSPGDELQTIQVGDLGIWVEDGPQAVLAVAIRGHAPVEVRHEMQRALELVHAEHGEALARFDGREGALEPAHPLVERCLLSRFTPGASRGNPWRAALVLGLVAALLVAWGITQAVRQHRRADLLERLRATPGLVLTETEVLAGRLVIAGLRDPLAPDPLRAVVEAGLATNSVEFHWTPYLALTPEFVVRRAERRLNPPAEVRLSLADGLLTVAGGAPRAWWDEARRVAPGIPGIDRVEFQPAGPTDLETLEALVQELRTKVIHFELAQPAPPEPSPALQQVADLLRRLVALAQTTDKHPVIRLIGQTDRTGAETFNQRLSVQRAENVRQRLVAQGLPAALFEVSGTRPRPPGRGETSAAAGAPSERRVTFDVRWAN